MYEKMVELWFRAGESPSLKDLVKFFEARRLCLMNPATGELTVVSDQGDPAVVAPTILYELFDQGALLRFNFWFDAYHNLFTQYGESGTGGYKLRHGLDGLARAHLNQIAAALLKLVCSGSYEIDALIMDSDGDCEGIDWLNWICETGPKRQLPIWPELIALPKGSLATWPAPPTHYAREEEDRLVILYDPRRDYLDQAVKTLRRAFGS